MAILVQTILDQARIRFKDLTETQALAYLNLVYKEVIRDFPILLTQSNYSITAGTQEYTLGETVTKIWDAQLASSSTDNTPLKGTTTDELDALQPGWRYWTSGNPQFFYITRDSTGVNKLGLHPKPDTTTSGTYPRVETQVSKEPASDLVAGDSMPNSIKDTVPFVFGICYRHAMIRYPEQYDGLYQMYLRECQRMSADLRTKIAGLNPKVDPPIVRGATRA